MERGGEPAGGPRGVGDLIRGGHDVGRVLGHGQPPSPSIEDPAALTRDGHGLGVLALGVGAQRSALDPLDPGGAADREAEQEQEAGEQEADSPLDHGISAPSERVSPPEASRLAAAAASLGFGRT